MGCNQSKDDDVVALHARSDRQKPGAVSKRFARSRVTSTNVDDLTAELVQHKQVADIHELFDFQDVIGEGHFGCIKKAVSRASGKEWAVKIVRLTNEVDRDALRNEISILRRLHHPQIVRVVASYEDRECMYMVMQLCKGKELYEHVYADARQFSEDDVKRLIRSLLRAVAFLHSNFIIHRDLKLENLLLENAANPSSLKVCDFGLSTRFKAGEKLQKSLGTIDYVAPEVLENDYTEKCDLWSVGVICYELLTGVSPFHAATPDETMAKIFDGVLVFQDSVWRQYSPAAITFVKSLVKEDVDARLSAHEALSHKWLSTLDADETNTERLRSSKKLLLTNMLSFSHCRKMKQTALLSVALGVSEDRIHQAMAAEVFHSMDTAKGGTLTRDEFCDAMVECGISKADASELFTRINQSKSGTINFLEFMAAAMDQRDIGQNTIKEAFGLLDGESKGRLSIVGLQDVFKQSLVAEEVQEMIASADLKGDGFVDFEEFQEMFKQPNSPLATVEERSSVAPSSTQDSFAGELPEHGKLRGTLTSSNEGSAQDDTMTQASSIASLSLSVSTESATSALTMASVVVDVPHGELPKAEECKAAVGAPIVEETTTVETAVDKAARSEEATPAPRETASDAQPASSKSE
jgi:calcium-dependent protein kinase